MTRLSSIAGFPWSIKLFYGLISDNVPIWGSKRKSYVVMMGALQFISLALIFVLEPQDPNLITFLLFCSSLTGAYLDVIVDAMMVTYSRIDEEDGSEQLQSLSWISLGAGGIFGSLFGGFMTQSMHPKWGFLLYSLYGLVVMGLGLMLKEEGGKVESHKKMTLVEALKKHFNQLKEGIMMPEIHMTIGFYVISACFGPSFEEYWYFF